MIFCTKLLLDPTMTHFLDCGVIQQVVDERDPMIPEIDLAIGLACVNLIARPERKYFCFVPSPPS